MATKKAKEHSSGVDRWTSNGKGIQTVGSLSPEHKARVDALKKELSATKKTGKKPAKK